MPRFNTIATELVEHAEVAFEHFRQLGYTVKVEPYEIHYPFRPALVCKRNHTQLAIVVCGRIEMQQLKDWVSLASSMTSDFRIAICIPPESTQKHLPKHQLDLQKLGIGVFVSADGNLAHFSDPVDQNINVQLPPLANQSRAVRKVLGPAYEHFNGGRWRDCFDEACTAFEQEARPYFKNALESGRLNVFDDKGHIKNPTAERIAKMTLGQLGVEFGKARPLNGTDSKIQKAIIQINPDRVSATHKNKKAQTEKRLRKNVGVHMHVIVQAVRELKK